MKSNPGQIVRRYATALFEAALESGALEQIADEADGFTKVFSPEVISFFINPGFTPEVKQQTIEEMTRGSSVHAILGGTFKLLLANKRIALVTEVLGDFLRKADTHRGIARVSLYTAHAITAEETREFEKALGDSLKKKVVLTQSVDASLKAGYVVKIGSTLVDASLKSRLQSLKETLSQGV